MTGLAMPLSNVCEIQKPSLPAIAGGSAANAALMMQQTPHQKAFKLNAASLTLLPSIVAISVANAVCTVQ